MDSATVKVIASLRRELDNLEVEAEAARAKAAEEASRREEIQTEVDALRCVPPGLGRKEFLYCVVCRSGGVCPSIPCTQAGKAAGW